MSSERRTRFETRVHNDPSRSPKVIDFGTESALTSYSTSINLGFILPRFRDIRAFVRQKSLFSAPHPNSGLNFGGVPLGVDAVLGSVESEHARLTNHEIMFEEFQPICDHNPPTSQTDGQTDDMRSQDRALH